MAARIVECVPNISEGRDQSIIDEVVKAADSIDGTMILDVDPGAATNRTVITFAGDPDSVRDSAFLLIKAASELIDMREHSGEHPRHGATDVCPFVPVSGVSMDECVQLAKELGERVGEELSLPVYLYEKAATKPEWEKLPNIREGEYEALPDKLGKKEWKPDFGPNEWNDLAARTGVVTIGARNFLIAYNVNINSKDKSLARDVGLTIRDKGRVRRTPKWKFVRDEDGNKVRQPGRLECCKATGWFIDEYDTAQVTMNLTDISVTPLHIAYEVTKEEVEKLGARVTGSEVVGLVPLSSMLEAGRYYLEKQNEALMGLGKMAKTTGVPEKELVEIAIRSMGLREVAPFNPEEKIIEYMVADKSVDLSGMTCQDFVDELSVDSPAPGGGSAAALIGSIAAALDSMVVNLTVRKRNFRDSWPEMLELAPRAQEIKEALVDAIDEDTRAFNRMVAAMRQDSGVQEAIKGAIEVPLGVLRNCPEICRMAAVLEEKGFQDSVSDAGVAAAAARAAAVGAYYNVIINLESIEDENYSKATMEKAEEMLREVEQASGEVFEKVRKKLLSKVEGAETND
ncbi:glutamate formimidoyltransferase [Candidatus Fermentibacteria bacterium]|nr:glutamate formimidoyltransferase [Candidatus Fermentibacteria bacterium]